MDRFYISEACKITNYIDNREEVKHITKVLRMKSGDRFEIFDITGSEYIAEIVSIQSDRVDFKIIEECFGNRELKTRITLYQGLPKQQKIEYIIQKSTELGIDTVVPCNFKRCVSELKEKEEKKIERWQKIALEAAKQSKRNKIPKIQFSMGLNDALIHMRENDFNIVFYELEKEKTLKSLIRSLEVNPSKVGIFVGPEGGFTEEEVNALMSNGAYCVTLGDRILRTETAAVYGITILGYEYQ